MDAPHVVAGCLAKKRIAVFVEHKFIPEEIEAYRSAFRDLGAEVDFVSRIWYGSWCPESVVFYSDIDPIDAAPETAPTRLEVRHDVSTVAANIDTYAAIIMSANYTSVRLRWTSLPMEKLADLTSEAIAAFDPRAHVQESPVVRLFATAMENPRIVKGALCHGLWILTPNPALLAHRRVICHSVVMADILNCGAIVQVTPTGVVVDGDLVTGFSKHEVLPFINAVAGQILASGVNRP